MPDPTTLPPSHPSWVVLWATGIGFVVRLLKSEKVPAPFDRIPPKARPLVALFLGQFSAAIVAAALPGVTWQQAAIAGLWSAALAVFGHDVLIEYLRAGKEPLQTTPPVEVPPADRVPPEGPADGS